ncbi:MAG: DUF1292 domain-containing protein [Clostridia bacterium]|nr:DUF1292 domain-containing protein [Clostridia bacterium]MBR1685210.1 DUF1292 domain-containing protein [Clostridia bacterium]
MNENDIITFHDENGVRQDFAFLSTVEYEDKYYLLLSPVAEGATFEGIPEDDEIDVLILRVDQIEGGEATYVTVDDTELFNKLIDIYNAMDEIDVSVFDTLTDSEEDEDNA